MGGGASKNSFRHYLEEREHPFQSRNERIHAVLAASRYRAPPSSSQTTSHEVAILQKGKILTKDTPHHDADLSLSKQPNPNKEEEEATRSSPRRINTLPVKETKKFFKKPSPYSSEPLFSWFKKKQRPAKKTFPISAINEKGVIVDEASVWHNARIWVSNPDETETSVVDAMSVHMTHTQSSDSLGSNEEQPTQTTMNSVSPVGSIKAVQEPIAQNDSSDNNNLPSTLNVNNKNVNSIENLSMMIQTAPPTVQHSRDNSKTIRSPRSLTSSQPSSNKNEPNSAHQNVGQESVSSSKHLRSQRTGRIILPTNNNQSKAPLERNRSSSLPNDLFPIQPKRSGL
ncbi:hypothetical protein FDP41_005374 [Naegleria fowleri]|uniref:Uncharacterized protein n=1 Tax=Naegleria fowleri TaxID=5763 RepID=A0A6A5BN19_NAEFO|nr:uncharacterized protein FDP41_005374 [Naegleria fowleri]KAF0975380.1 hypothetical protein FDP41_005374 [Naegleria fowleri]